jgi:hypothetical protein
MVVLNSGGGRGGGGGGGGVRLNWTAAAVSGEWRRQNKKK